jgi:polyisoprenoid-binding protein YceI
VNYQTTGGPARHPTPVSQEEKEMARFELDPTHTHIGFTARHLMVSTVRGNFSEWTGYVEGDENDPGNAVAQATIKTASLTSGAADRDKHLRSADFFDVDQYPEMTYRSTKVEKIDNNNYRVEGELTIKNVTRPVSLEVEVGDIFSDGWGNERIGVSATGKINRKDWGLEWNMVMEAGRLLVSEHAKLEIDTELVRKLESAEAVA